VAPPWPPPTRPARGVGLPTLIAVATAALGCGEARLYPIRRDAPGGMITCPDAMVGFATVQGGTTGGNDPIAPPAPVDVDTLADFTTAAQSDAPQIIRVHGLLANTGTSEVRVKSNKTIVGVEPGSGFTGGGLDLTDADNIILRNLVISKATVGESDAITILRSHHIWIDHCDLSSAFDGGNYDGLVDVTHASDFVTVSWTALHDHKNTSLVGHSVDNAAEDTGHLTATYHHNLFLRVYDGPRVRFGSVHLYNNHFQNVDIDASGKTNYGVVSSMGAEVVVEQNVFEDVGSPMLTRYESEAEGAIRDTSNKYVGTASASANVITNSTAWPPPYPYTPDSADSVAALVGSCAGVGRISP
jgi:pectate lyase